MRSYPEVVQTFRWESLWELFEGDRTRLNLATECVDRHPAASTALRVQVDDGRSEEYSFGELSAWSSRFARFLEADGVARGDGVAIMLEPSLEFYGAVFGTLKRGAVAIPLFTLLGPEGMALRIDDCRPRMLVVASDGPRWQQRFPHVRVVTIDGGLVRRLTADDSGYTPATAADDLAVLQYTSGTTRGLPEAVRHTHRSVVTLMIAALYGVGLRAGDRYFCPSSPAWGHGLWHGTIAPLALGIAVGAYAGKFQAARLLQALEHFEITNLAAAPTVYRLLRNSGLVERHALRLQKVSFTGEPMDSSTREFVERALQVVPCSMYGSTEVGVILVNYPGFSGYTVRAGALGKPAPGWEVAVLDETGSPIAAPDVEGEIAVKRRDGWFPIKDRGHVDRDGYFHHGGRSDDAIISAGWTMSAIEIEDALLAHPAVREAAVVGVADAVRGQIPRAYLVADRRDAAFATEIQDFVKRRLSLHEYPRSVQFVDELPRTPAGKVNRKALRERAQETE